MEDRLLESSETLTRRVWEESKKLWRIAFPAIMCRVASFGTIMVVQAFIGHISELDFASYALTQTLILRFVGGVLLGMSSATETLCGQAFGAKQYHMLGIYLQRSWIINMITATLLVPIFIFTKQIFTLLGEEDDIATEAGKISLWVIPIMYSYVFSFTIQQYLQSQLKNAIVGWLFASSFVLAMLLSWTFVTKLDLGVPGVMGAFILSTWAVVFGEFVYLFGGWCSDTWQGFSLLALSDLLPAIKLSISSGVMLCLELWYNSVLVLLAGYMTNAVVSISAFSICLSIASCIIMVSFGFLGSASVRVSNELGRGNANAAKFSVMVILCTSVIIGAFFSVMFLVFGDKVAYLFTNDEEIVETVSSQSVLVALQILLNSVHPVLSGVAVGAGRQSMVAYVNIGSYYVVGVPVGVLLVYLADLQIKGLWIGMTCGVALQVLVLGYITWATDWDDQVKKTVERLNKWVVIPSDKPEERPNQN